MLSSEIFTQSDKLLNSCYKTLRQSRNGRFSSVSYLTFGGLCSNSADNRFLIFFLLFFAENKIVCHSNCLLDNLHSMSNSIFWAETRKNIRRCFSAEIFIQLAKYYWQTCSKWQMTTVIYQRTLAYIEILTKIAAPSDSLDKSSCTIRFSWKKLAHCGSKENLFFWHIANSFPASVVCWSLQTVWAQIRQDKMSGLILIQTVWWSDGIFLFEKS